MSCLPIMHIVSCLALLVHLEKAYVIWVHEFLGFKDDDGSSLEAKSLVVLGT